MPTANHFREQADALYSLAKETRRGDDRLALALEAMEFEARALGVERGKIPADASHTTASRDRESVSEPRWADQQTPRQQSVERD
jgi:hypothetical protein